MKLIKCPKCGEMYSDSYKTCPFCQEDEALKGRSAAPHRKVTKHRRAPSILGPAMVLVVVLAAVLVGVLLFGGKGSANKPADKPPVEEPTPAPTEPLTLDQTTLNMNQGETATLTVTGAENVLWTSSDPNVATVDDSGTVTAGVPGTATITVTTADGSQSAACTVQVATPLPPEPPKEDLDHRGPQDRHRHRRRSGHRRGQGQNRSEGYRGRPERQLLRHRQLNPRILSPRSAAAGRFLSRRAFPPQKTSRTHCGS